MELDAANKICWPLIWWMPVIYCCSHLFLGWMTFSSAKTSWVWSRSWDRLSQYQVQFNHTHTHTLSSVNIRKWAVSVSGNKLFRIESLCAKLSTLPVWTLCTKCFCLQLSRVSLPQQASWWFIGGVISLKYAGLIESLRDVELWGRDNHTHTNTHASSLWRQRGEAFQGIVQNEF